MENISEKFLEKKPNCITMKEVAGLQTASELVAPEIPMLINTIENTYENIAVYGKGKYADKIYNYLLGNKNINVFRIEEADLNFLKNSYCVQCKQKIDMLLILDFLVDRTIYNQIGENILTIFARKMYYSNLKSTGNNLDINKNIIPLLLRNHIQVIWVGIPDFEKTRNHNKIGHAIRLWSLLRIMFIPVSYFSLFGQDESEGENFTSKNRRYYKILSPQYIKNYSLKEDLLVDIFPVMSMDGN